MGIVSNFRTKTLPSLFKTFHEAVIKVTYKVKTTGTYTPGSGAVDTFDEVTNVRVIRKKYEAEEIDNIIRAGDVQFLVEAISLGRTPEANAFFELPNGETWSIVGFTGKPIDSPVTYGCQCRQVRN